MNQELLEIKQAIAEAPPPTDAEVAAEVDANFVLLRMLVPLEPRTGHGTVTRNKFIKKNPDWAPNSSQMAKLAAEGTLRSITKVHIHASAEKREQSMLNRYIGTVGYANSALDSVELLDGGYRADEAQGTIPDIRLIRPNRAIMTEVATYLADRTNLDKYKWPKDNSEQVEDIYDLLRASAPPAVIAAFEATMKAKRKEHTFWTRQAKRSQANKFIKEAVHDSSRNLPVLRARVPRQAVDDSKLIALADELEEKRRFAGLREAEGSLDRYIPKEVDEIRTAMFDDNSDQETKVRHKTEGGGSSEYAARLDVYGVKAVGLAVPKVRESRYHKGKPVRGHVLTSIADTPSQAHAERLTVSQSMTEQQKLVHRTEMQQLGAVLPHESLEDKPDK